jgi:hypothetical protein
VSYITLEKSAENGLDPAVRRGLSKPQRLTGLFSTVRKMDIISISATLPPQVFDSSRITLTSRNLADTVILTHDGGWIMSKRKLGFIVIALMVVGAVVPALLAPDIAEAADVYQMGWMVYTPNHPNGCAPLPYDCYVVWVYPSSP